MTLDDSIRIVEVPLQERKKLEPLLEQSFEGLYLWHSKKTLKETELVKAAELDGEYVGLVMLKRLPHSVGYIYYIAVSKSRRHMGIGGKLLDDSLEHFFKIGVEEAYAGVEEDNEQSLELFHSRGFAKTSFGEMSKKYGRIGAAALYAKMWIVLGEIVLTKKISKDLFESSEISTHSPAEQMDDIQAKSQKW
jgi:ribosomal protein S18 acetylase RimI-like enzyme